MQTNRITKSSIRPCFLLFCLCFVFFSLNCTLFSEEPPAEPVGKRPYELDWAQRFNEDNTPLVDFEKDMAWTVETNNAEASFQRSREQQIWGHYTGRLSYRATGASPVITIRPQEPIPIPGIEFDAISIWIYGNNWFWENDSSTPKVTIQIVFLLPDGTEWARDMGQVGWKEWFLNQIHLSPDQQERLCQPGTCFAGIRILNGTNTEERILFFDNFSLFREKFEPLSLTERPKRSLTLFPGQTPGQNTGEGTLPFPTREETIIPEPKQGTIQTLTDENGHWLFSSSDEDGKLEIQYQPDSGTWTDVTARWNGSAPFFPLKGGGINQLVSTGKSPEPIIKRRLLDAKVEGNRLDVRWEFSSETLSQEVLYRFELIGKCLVLDTLAHGGKIPFVDFGTVSDIRNAFSFPIPYYQYGHATNLRPFVVGFQPEESEVNLFLLVQFDWYRSNASDIRANRQWGTTNIVSGPIMAYNPKTDGKYNDVFERFTVTISPHFQEVLPIIANPVSPWKEITGKKVWAAHGAGNPRQNDYKYWRNYWCHGIREMLVTDHETCWRDGGESFTFRTKAAPDKYGDQGMADYSRFMQDTLGYVYGPYNNFTDFAPVNEFWNVDMVTRTSDNQLLHAWARCYAPKPAKAVEYCEKLSPINQEKFHFSTAYCDVHTAVTPWSRTDYDARVPGAGTFAATYYAFGEIMLLQKKAWNGPVYSEGQMHAFYSGLTDGNYAQDQAYSFHTSNWLVDFDLLKIHPLECNFGMGNLSMFDGNYNQRVKTDHTFQNVLDEYLAATLAFGHPGFLVRDFDMSAAMTSYFMIQQIAAHYTQSEVAAIYYIDADGNKHTTDDALFSNVIDRRQIWIEYKDGTIVCVNGNRDTNMNVEVPVAKRGDNFSPITFTNQKMELPPLGWYAWTADKSVLSCSCLVDSKRVDFAVSPDYIFVNTRNQDVTLPWSTGNGVAVCRKAENGKHEIILEKGNIGFVLDVNHAVVFDTDGKDTNETPVLRTNGFTFITPVPDVHGYRLDKTEKTEIGLCTDPLFAVPGKQLTVYKHCSDKNNFNDSVQITVPQQTIPGTPVKFETPLGDIIVPAVPPITVENISLDGTIAHIIAHNHIMGTGPITLNAVLNNQSIPVQAISIDDSTYAFEFNIANESELSSLNLQFSNGESATEVHYNVQRNLVFDEIARQTNVRQNTRNNPLYSPHCYIQYRDQPPQSDTMNTGAELNYRNILSCNNQTKSGYFVHPPYLHGTGRAWLENHFTVPDGTPLTLHASVGKLDDSVSGDGILFKIILIDESGQETELATATVTESAWKDLTADISPWCGKTITLRFISDVGPNNDPSGDWSAWADVRLESGTPNTVYSLEKKNNKPE